MTEPKDLLLVNEQLRRSNRLLRWLKRGWQTLALVLALALVLVVIGVIWGIVQYITWVIQRVLSTPVGF
jgi:ABC-type proline/glycine betaine transport system permease subunit